MSWEKSPHIQTFKLFAIVVAVCLSSFYLISSVLVPVVISFTLYALFEPATLYLVRHNFNHSLSIMIMLVFLLIVSVLIIGFALPALFDQVTLLQSKLPQIAKQLEKLLTGYGEFLANEFGANVDISELTLSILSESSSLGQSALIKVSNSLLNFVIFFILVPFLTYYLLKDFKRARNDLMNWLPNSSFELGWLIYHNVSRQLNAYTRGVMLQSLIMAVFCSLGFSLIGLDIPVLLGAITGMLNLVPYVGPVISVILALLVGAAMTPFEPSVLYLAVAVIIAAQIFDNLVVIPAVVAHAVDLHPVQAILGIIIFGSLFGTVGVILAMPAIAAGKIVISNIYADMANASLKSVA
ncbi:MAG: AI-2E family transporter [Gammaproteobacteria bacterium]|nr:AI-2E family transporter [Gammaproteobacteria bacterium]MDH3449851.1 AI-2E family transporter [Gammaproteobacteria bacterium]